MPSHYEVSADGRSYYDADRGEWVPFGSPAVASTDTTPPIPSDGDSQLADVHFVERIDPQPYPIPGAAMAPAAAPGGTASAGAASGGRAKMPLATKIVLGFVAFLAGSCAVGTVGAVVVGFAVGDYTSGTDCGSVVSNVLASEQSRADRIVRLENVDQVSGLPDDFEWPDGAADRVLIAECVGDAVVAGGATVPIVVRLYAIGYPDKVVEWQLDGRETTYGGMVEDGFGDD